MITLCMDTSHKFLAVSLIKDDQVIASVQEDCWKKQSEYIFPVITKMTEDNNIRPEDIDNVVITKGPGSFTGVRIAMTIAKVFCAMAGKQLYTLETLQLYAGKKDCTVLLDARGKRAYTARFHDGKPLTETAAVPLNEIELSDEDIVIGDGHLAGLPDNYPDLAENFLALKNEWKAVENVHLLTPEYLKSTSDYMVKK
ncbi:MAG: tRNA (adenosine(37)-N6)-threonylcarbamoyltransferase complex dimerization subunit type 1 TsaB [Solobacterium sp.]|nr:tRNA (adenosine(37)-N6)-threonylcarbamoyltransferase complex dimerization subunit type 1 TsaB [Solobacterium sp.]